MKHLNFIWVLLLSISVVQAQDFVVEAGTTKKISESLNVDRFIMEDGSTLQIENVQTWKLEAISTSIGANCIIKAIPTFGANGRNGAGYSKRAGKCKTGATGNKGGHGQSGGRGTSIYIKTKFENLVNLIIDTRGGRGGHGGHGGKGQRGGAKKPDVIGWKCGGGHGGRGGDGGNAGLGGNGGDVDVYYGIGEDDGFEPKMSVGAISKDKGVISILNQKGKNGKVGNAGSGGAKGGDKNNGDAGSIGKVPDGKVQDGKVNYSSYKDDCLSYEGDDTRALIVWITDYAEPEPAWRTEALALYNVLETKYNFRSIDTLANPSSKNLLKAIKRQANTGQSDKVLIYISGHGVNRYDETTYGILTPEDDIVSFDDIYATLNKCKAQNSLLIMDACYSGKILDNSNINGHSPKASTVMLPYQTCGFQSKSIITAGFEEEKVDNVMTNAIVKILDENKADAITDEQLFMEMVGKDRFVFDTQRPSMGRFIGMNKGAFIFKKLED